MDYFIYFSTEFIAHYILKGLKKDKRIGLADWTMHAKPTILF